MNIKYIICALMLSILMYTAKPAISLASENLTLGLKSSTTITFYTYNEQIVDESDNSGLMSSYLGRDVRSVINLYHKAGERLLITTQYMIKNGKDVLWETNDNGTTLNSVRQYTPYGKTVDYASSTSKK